MADVITPSRTTTRRETAPPPSAPWDAAFMLRLRRELAEVRTAATRDAALGRLAAILGALQLWDALAVATPAAGSDAPALTGLLAPAAGLGASLRLQLAASAKQAVHDRRTVMHRAQDPAGWIIAVPCDPSDASAGALLAVSTAVDAVKPSQSFVLELAAAELAAGRVRCRLLALDSDLQRTAAVVELVERLLLSRTKGDVDRRLANELARAFGAVRVVIGRRESESAGLHCSALAGGDSPSSQFTELALGVLEETISRGRLCQWPTPTPSDEAGLLLHRQCSAHHSDGWLVTQPITLPGGAAAALLIQGDAAQGGAQESCVRLLTAAAGAISGAYAAAHRAERSVWQRWRAVIGGVLRRRRVWTWSAAVAAAAGCLALPVPHRIECDCAVEPVVRQFVAAPFTAPLEAVLVQPGEEVARDQVLARLDGREVRWELAGVTADLQRASRERDGHLAKHDPGAARLSELECERLQLQTNLLQHRASQLEVRSPIDGLVLTGDLDQVIGAPLKTGQTLFELAPLDSLVVEIAIPEREIPFAAAGQLVTFWLESRPDEPYAATIARIHPRSEHRDGASVFIAAAHVPNADGWLRPGLSGTARLDAGQCRLGWRLFHRPWERFRVWWGF